VPSVIFNRFLSLTQVKLTAVTKLKEKSSTNVEKTNETVIPLNVADVNKTYSDTIHRIVDQISKLSLVEVMDLNELLKVNIYRFFYLRIQN